MIKYNKNFQIQNSKIKNSLKLQSITDCFIYFFFRTVEINNTDAEGRLVLGDGVS